MKTTLIDDRQFDQIYTTDAETFAELQAKAEEMGGEVIMLRKKYGARWWSADPYAPKYEPLLDNDDKECLWYCDDGECMMYSLGILIEKDFEVSDEEDE